jgi:hypothetical protein
MKRMLLMLSSFFLMTLCLADDPGDQTPQAAAAPTPAVQPMASKQPATAAITRVAPPSGDASATTAAGAPDAAKFVADAQWEIAGYNNEEIIYTILVTNQDSRIIHCNAELQGFYIEKGEKHPVSDRQGASIFPGKKISVGHWMGMDQKSGATYSVKCRPI